MASNKAVQNDDRREAFDDYEAILVELTSDQAAYMRKVETLESQLKALAGLVTASLTRVNVRLRTAKHINDIERLEHKVPSMLAIYAREDIGLDIMTKINLCCARAHLDHAIRQKSFLTKVSDILEPVKETQCSTSDLTVLGRPDFQELSLSEQLVWHAEMFETYQVWRLATAAAGVRIGHLNDELTREMNEASSQYQAIQKTYPGMRYGRSTAGGWSSDNLAHVTLGQWLQFFNTSLENDTKLAVRKENVQALLDLTICSSRSDASDCLSKTKGTLSILEALSW